MKPFDRVWETTYTHDRRKHRHRCRCCGRVLNSGERAVLMRVPNKRTTWALHESCAEMRHSVAYTWREVFQHWADPER